MSVRPMLLHRMALVFFFLLFRKIWATCENFLGKWFTAPLAKDCPYAYAHKYENVVSFNFKIFLAVHTKSHTYKLINISIRAILWECTILSSSEKEIEIDKFLTEIVRCQNIKPFKC